MNVLTEDLKPPARLVTEGEPEPASGDASDDAVSTEDVASLLKTLGEAVERILATDGARAYVEGRAKQATQATDLERLKIEKEHDFRMAATLMGHTTARWAIACGCLLFICTGVAVASKIIDQAAAGIVIGAIVTVLGALGFSRKT